MPRAGWEAGNTSEGTDAQWATYQQLFEDVEAIGPRARALILHGPVPENPANIRKLVRQRGEAQAVAMVIELWDRMFPGWRNPFGTAKRKITRKYSLEPWKGPRR